MESDPHLLLQRPTSKDGSGQKKGNRGSRYRKEATSVRLQRFSDNAAYLDRHSTRPTRAFEPKIRIQSRHKLALLRI